MQVEDGEDGASAGRGEGGADAPAAGARPSEHAAAPARPATADAIKEMMLAFERGHQAHGGVPGGGSTDDAAGSGSEYWVRRDSRAQARTSQARWRSQAMVPW